MQHWTLLAPPDTSTHLGHFHLPQPLHFSCIISLLLSSGILGTYQPGGLIFLCHIFFFFSYCSWGSQGKNAEVISVVSFSSGPRFCNSSSWPIHLGWAYPAWLIFSLSLTSLWWMCSVWLVFCDYGFHSVCLLMDEDKRLVEASWWEGLAVG